MSVAAQARAKFRVRSPQGWTSARGGAKVRIEEAPQIHRHAFMVSQETICRKVCVSTFEQRAKFDDTLYNGFGMLKG